ncbi:Basic leucine zipper 61 [Linum grandiflorum]
MAQLPPKIPTTMLPSWPDFSSDHKLMHSSASTAVPPPSSAANSNKPSWVDEFLDFSSARRGNHRRSVSDGSVAFLEVPMLDDGPHHRDFERFDDEQFMSMFSVDDMSNSIAAAGNPASSSNPSTPSDHNSINDEKEATLAAAGQQERKMVMKMDADEEQSPSESEYSQQTTPSNGISNNSDRIVDPKRVKRILANRQSAQRSRVRKLQYISELERSVTSLQAEVSVLSPRVAFLDHQRLLLNVDNSALKQRIAALAQDKIFKDG